MSIEQPVNERRELYDKFRAELRVKGAPTEYYDEDDLVAVFDQANDFEDEYVKLEVLILGARLYPNSELLAVRKGYYYHDIDQSEAVDDMLAHHVDADGPLWTLLRILQAGCDSGQIQHSVEVLVNGLSDIDDETMIQIIDIVGETDGGIDWLKTHEKQLQSKTAYLPTLYYELQAVATNCGEYDYARHALECLTEADPFQAEYWSMLAEAQFRSDDYEAALSSIDYALAIDELNINAIRIKARVLICSTPHDPAEIKAMLDLVLLDVVEDSLLVNIYAAVHIEMNKPDEAFKFLSDYLANHPDDHSVMAFTLSVHHPESMELLKKHYEASRDFASDDMWCKWARDLYDEGEYADAAQVLATLAVKSTLSEEMTDMLCCALYESAAYNACESRMLTLLDESPDELTNGIIAVGLLSMLRLKKKKMALLTIGKLKAKPLRRTDKWSINKMFGSIGMSAYIAIIEEFAKSRRTNVDEIDPFIDPDRNPTK